ncbi:MAG: hypothetical protein KatS3mg131_0252 [Candidatus Tectimicrobiota bacterium]|nr:MAG: hypothetical protein KatS3mg131_0252 [Candidatus Tectomicrobia bacterium]
MVLVWRGLKRGCPSQSTISSFRRRRKNRLRALLIGRSFSKSSSRSSVGRGLLANAVSDVFVFLEQVFIEEQKEPAERVLSSSVRRRREEEQMIGLAGERLHRLVALALLELGAVLVGRELVGLVDHHEVPLRLGSGLETALIARQEIDGRDEDALFVAGELAGLRFERGAIDEPRVEAELLLELLFFPLLRQAARCDDEDLLDRLPGRAAP